MNKLLEIIFIITVTYLWNRFIPKLVVGLSVNFHKKYNAHNLHRQPLKFMVEYEKKIIIAYQTFFWVGAIVIIIDILIG